MFKHVNTIAALWRLIERAIVILLLSEALRLARHALAVVSLYSVVGYDYLPHILLRGYRLPYVDLFEPSLFLFLFYNPLSLFEHLAVVLFKLILVIFFLFERVKFSMSVLFY